MAAMPWIALGLLVAQLRRGGQSWDEAWGRRWGARGGLALAGAGLVSWLAPFSALGGAPGCGPFGSTTFAASAAALLLPVALGAVLGSRGWRERALAGAAALALAAWVFSLGVRAGWIAAGVGAAFALAGSASARVRRGAALAGLLVLAALWFCPWRLFPAGGPAGGSRTAREELLAALDLRRDSSGERLTLWRNGLELVARAPWLGLGLGRLRDEYPLALEHGAPHAFTSLDVHRSPHHLHSDPLEVWVELGPLGLALWIALARAAWIATRGSATSRGVVASFGLLGLFHTALGDAAALALLAPALAAVPGSRPPRRGSDGRLPRAARSVVVVCASAAAALGLFGLWRRVAADRAHGAALEALAEPSSSAAAQARGLELARRAVALDPEDTEKLLGLAAWLRRAGAPEAALVALEAAARTGPGSLARRGLLAELLHDLGRRGEARSALDDLLALQPQNREAHVALADWSEREDGVGAGWAPLERLARAIPWLDDPRLWLRLGRYRLQAHASFGASRHLREAEDALQRAIAKPGLSPAELGTAFLALMEARALMRGRPRPIEGLDLRLRRIWPTINPEEIRADLLGRLRSLSATMASEGRADEARQLEILVSDLIAR
ncbi:MAG: O-antigen ligase family protein [Planctomycetes bacterium]|nr:O-antigen ligase family protein [Planctomycetota bacterium]